MTKHNKEYNMHHCIPSSRWWISSDVNLLKMEIRQHDNRHRVFVNATSVEQLCKVLLLNKKVWSDKFRDDILEVLENHINNYYRDKVRSGFDKQEVKNVLDLETKLYNDWFL